MASSFLSGPHEFADFKGVFTIVSACFSCQGRGGGPGCLDGLYARRGRTLRRCSLDARSWDHPGNLAWKL